MMLRVKLANRGNPDFKQDRRKPLPHTPADRFVKVKDYAEASRVCWAYIERYDLGGGNWVGGDIVDSKNMVIARVSYNCCVWPPGQWMSDMKPLYEPS